MGSRRAIVSQRFSPTKTLDGFPQRLLDQGRIEHLVKRLRNILSENEEVVQKLSSEAEYFERNASRMRYPEFRKLGLFVVPGW